MRAVRDDGYCVDVRGHDAWVRSDGRAMNNGASRQGCLHALE